MPISTNRARFACTVLCALALAALTGCNKAAKAPPAAPAASAPAAAPEPGAAQTPPTAGSSTSGPVEEVPGGGKVVAVVFGATENDPWTSSLLAGIANACHINPLSKGDTANGLDTFGPYNAKLDGQLIELHIAMCDFSSTADIAEQQKLGEAARNWIAELHPAAVWLDGDPAQLHIGKDLDPALTVVYSGAEVASDLFYDEGRLVCGVPKRPSVSRAMTELLKLAPAAKNVALVCDDSALGLSRIKEIRDLEPALLQGMTFVTQPPAMSWAELHKTLAGLDSGIHGVIVTAMGAHGSKLAGSGKPCPADLLSGVKQPVVTLGPTSMDNSGALSLRIKPDAHARAVLAILGKLLSGTKPQDIPTTIPDDMELYKNEK